MAPLTGRAEKRQVQGFAELVTTLEHHFQKAAAWIGNDFAAFRFRDKRLILTEHDAFEFSLLFLRMGNLEHVAEVVRYADLDINDLLKFFR
jgi:hypothetical protein